MSNKYTRNSSHVLHSWDSRPTNMRSSLVRESPHDFCGARKEYDEKDYSGFEESHIHIAFFQIPTISGK